MEYNKSWLRVPSGRRQTIQGGTWTRGLKIKSPVFNSSTTLRPLTAQLNKSISTAIKVF